MDQSDSAQCGQVMKHKAGYDGNGVARCGMAGISKMGQAWTGTDRMVEDR